MDLRWFKMNTTLSCPISNIITRIIPGIWAIFSLIFFLLNNKIKNTKVRNSLEYIIHLIGCLLMLLGITVGMYVRNDISNTIRFSTYNPLLIALSLVFVGLPIETSLIINTLFAIISLSSVTFINYIDGSEDMIMGIITSLVNYTFIFVLNKELRDDFLLKKQTEELAYTDNLTHAYNRNYVQNFLLDERGRLKNPDAGILMFDIDFFKKFNDTYGHLTGDQVLKKVADIVRKSIRSTDLLVRFGGEEFLVILNGNITVEYLNIVAKRVHDDIKLISDIPEPITISIGGTKYSESLSFYKNVSIADRALYDVKEGGRNNTIIY